jgi:hypothetical protein
MNIIKNLLPVVLLAATLPVMASGPSEFYPFGKTNARDSLGRKYALFTSPSDLGYYEFNPFWDYLPVSEWEKEIPMLLITDVGLGEEPYVGKYYPLPTYVSIGEEGPVGKYTLPEEAVVWWYDYYEYWNAIYELKRKYGEELYKEKEATGEIDSICLERAKHIEGPYPVLGSYIYWANGLAFHPERLKNITSIIYPPTYKLIADFFGPDYCYLPSLQEVFYSPYTPFLNPYFVFSSLRYLNVYSEEMLKGDNLFVDFKQETYDEYGTYIWRRWVPITCTTLEYIVSFVENPSPLSFYRDFVREGKWEKETVWVNAFEFHYCLFGKDLSEIDLYVPEESIELYRSTADWNKFRKILPMTDEMKNSYERAWNEAMTVKTPEGKDACVERWYSINGHRLSSPRKGINIGVMSDGSTRKVIVK